MRIYRFSFAAFISGLCLVLLAAPAYAATPLVESAKITGPDTVTIVYSEAVNTSLNDYGTFTGALSGASLESVSGSGTNVITLTFGGTTFAPSATGGLTIAGSVTSISDGSYIGSGPYNVVDGQAPVLSSFSMSSNLAGGTVARSGDALTISFSTSEPVTNAVATIDGTQVGAQGSGQGPYTASYTISSSDTQDTVPVSVSFTDLAGNQGEGSFMLGGGLGPHIVSIASDATASGALGAGNTIDFVLTLASPAPGAYVSGSYDGVPLTWTTNNGGATYNATFTVQSGDQSTAAPLQISNVTVRDSSGNVSIPASGADIEKTVNAESFLISQILAIASPVAEGAQPHFGFSSPQDGTIAYGGSCASPNLSAQAGDNYIFFNPLPDGTYSNCTVTVTDNAGYESNTLAIPSFSVGTGVSSAPAVSSTNASTYAYKFNNPLTVGSTGADVTALQERLTAEGVYSGPVTGYYGSLTEAAVEKYQGLHNLEQLGNVGPGTRADLNSGL